MLRPRSAGACLPRSLRPRETGPCSSRSPDREHVRIRRSCATERGGAAAVGEPSCVSTPPVGEPSWSRCAFGETDVGEGQALALRYKGRCCGPVARGPVPRNLPTETRNARSPVTTDVCCHDPRTARDRPSPYGNYQSVGAVCNRAYRGRIETRRSLLLPNHHLPRCGEISRG